MSEDEGVKYNIEKDISIKPKIGISTAQDLPIFLADDIKIFADGKSKLCTFIFLRKKIDATQGIKDGTVQVGPISYEIFLEIKIPFSAVIPMMLYVNQFLDDMQKASWLNGKFRPEQLT